MRRVPALAITVAAIVALVLVARTRPDAERPVFAEVRQPWMPAASGDAAASSWFCPGVPAQGHGRGGEVVVANTSGEVLRGTYALLTEEGEAVSEPLRLEANKRMVIDVDEVIDAPFASAVIELDRGGGVVEQRAVDPAGDSLAPCATTASAQWYVAEGFTLDDSVDQLVLTNPYDSDAVVSLSIVTDEGTRSPSELQGFPIAARTVEVIDVAALGARSEPIVGATVTAARGRVVMGRSQQFKGSERGGYAMTLAAPTPADQWWFTIGQRADGVLEEYRILNPTDSGVEVTAAALGVQPNADFPGLATVDVPAGEVATFAAGELDGLPEGPHAMVFSTVETPGVVVERIITRSGDQGPATSVSLGGLTRPDGFVANNWFIGTSPQRSTEGAIVIYNTVNVEANVSVRALDEAGFAAVPRLNRIRVPAGGLVSVDLSDEQPLGRTLLVTSDRQIFVERRIPRDGPLGGTTAAWAVPLDA